MIATFLSLLLAQASAAQAAGKTQPDARAPSEIVAAAPAGDWVAIPAGGLLIMDLAPDAAGKPRRVVIQLMPAPFSQGWVGNIRQLAAAHWWDGTSVNRVQDNYVVQWGDASEKKALPAGLHQQTDREYEQPIPVSVEAARDRMLREAVGDGVSTSDRKAMQDLLSQLWKMRDAYAFNVDYLQGWPVAMDKSAMWPVHCYGMVGVGRDLPPNTGTGAELYTVIGHAPRHLDRNIALVGRVVEGIEHLSSLPRGTGELGFYKTSAERTAIVRVRIASELPAGEQPRFEYLSTESASFAAYADARANRRDAFFIRPAGGADVCNIPVPVRRVK